MRFLVVSSLGLIAACGSGGSSTITVYADDAAFLAFNVGDEPFAPIPLEADEVYELEVDGPFGLAATCPGASVLTGVIYRAPEESDAWEMNCTAAAPPPMHTITITSVDNTALFGGCGLGSGMGNTFTFEAPEGPCDLLFTDDPVGEPTRVWRQNIEITGDASIDVDLRDGEDMMGIALNVDNGSTGYTTAGFIETPHGTRRYFYRSSAQSTLVPKPAVMLDGDVVGFRIVKVQGYDLIVGRELARDFVFADSLPLVIDFPPSDELPGAAFRIENGHPAVSFGTDFFGEPRWIEADQPGITMWADWSPDYDDEASRGHIEFPDLASLDGWDPAWNLVDADSWQMLLRHDGDDGTFVEISVF